MSTVLARPVHPSHFDKICLIDIWQVMSEADNTCWVVINKSWQKIDNLDNFLAEKDGEMDDHYASLEVNALDIAIEAMAYC